MGSTGFKYVVLFFFLVTLSVVTAKMYHVPVLLWGPGYQVSKENSIPVFKGVSSDEFFNHFLKNVHKTNVKPPVVVFLEETLSNEDFSSRIGKYNTAFQDLEDITSKTNLEFLPSVENPVTALTSPNVKAYGFSFSELSDDKFEGTLKNGVIYLVNLEDADSKEDRPDMLQRHDGKIATIYKELVKNNKHLVAILTGRLSSWTEPEEVIRVRRQTNETARNESGPTKPAKAAFGVILETKSALIYTKNPMVLKIGNKEVTLQTPTSSVADDRGKWQRAIFSFVTEQGKMNLRFRFENASSNFWSLSQVELEGAVKELVLLTTKRQIGAPYDHSFHTSSPVVFSNGSISLTFSDMQVQPWKPSNDNESNKKFGIADDDVAFFTPGIWSGLLVTFVLGLILAWALITTISINTMDQFDDPKGKTITVNVTD